MKYLPAVAVILFLLCAASCGRTEEYKPDFTLAEGYTLSGDVISGTVYGEYAVMTYDIVSSYDRVTVFSDSTGEQYVEDGAIPLDEGENRFVLRFTDGTHEREYHLEIELVLLEDFEIRFVKPEKTYHIGEAFDKSSILIEARTSDGKTVSIDRYEAEYEFSDLGKSTVGIELGGIYHSFEVEVTEEYIPIGENRWRVDCSVNLDDFCDFFGIETDSTTISLGGWVMEQLGKVPEAGDSFEFECLSVSVVETDGQRVTFIDVEKKPEEAEEE